MSFKTILIYKLDEQRFPARRSIKLEMGNFLFQ